MIFANINIDGNIVSGSISLSELPDTIQDTLSLFICAVEKVVLRSDYEEPPGYNNVNKFLYVARKIWPEPYGYLFKLTDSITYPLNFNIILDNFKNIEYTRLIAFIQNTKTKEIYQANYFDPTLNDISPTPNSFFQIYPIPFTDELNIKVHHQNQVNYLEIYDIQGKLVYKEQPTKYFNVHKINTEKLTNGLYLLKINGYYRVKIIKL